MKTISIVKDKIDGKPFAVLVTSTNGLTRAFGALGQGERWATWVNAAHLNNAEILENLDITLFADKPIKANLVDLAELSQIVSPEEALRLSSEFEKKSLLRIDDSETKSLELPDDVEQYDDGEDVEDSESIESFPVTDALLASIDVAYKQHAVEYKARAFNLERQLSSITLQVKGLRAVWDNDMQGWRCPPETVNGGQFTNRLGLGCSFGAVRRLGQFLQSLDDRSQGELAAGLEPRGVLYRAGKLTENAADDVRYNRAQKYKNRAARRVRKANDRILNPTFRDTYNALNPDTPMIARARTAAGLRMARIGNDIAQQGFLDMTEGGRKARKVRKVEEISQDLRDNGGTGIPNAPMYFNPLTGEMLDIGAMVHNPWFANDVKQDGTPSGPQKDFKYITQEELLNGLGLVAKPPWTWDDVMNGEALKKGIWDESLFFTRDELDQYFSWEQKFRKSELSEKEKRKVAAFIKRKSNGDLEWEKPWMDSFFGNDKPEPSRRQKIGETILALDPINGKLSRKRKEWGKSILALDPLGEGKGRRARRRVEAKSKKSKLFPEFSSTHDFENEPTIAKLIELVGLTHREQVGKLTDEQSRRSAELTRDLVRDYDPDEREFRGLLAGAANINDSGFDNPSPAFSAAKELIDSWMRESGISFGEDAISDFEHLGTANPNFGTQNVSQPPVRVFSGPNEPGGLGTRRTVDRFYIDNFRMVTITDGTTERKVPLFERINVDLAHGPDDDYRICGIGYTSWKPHDDNALDNNLPIKLRNSAYTQTSSRIGRGQNPRVWNTSEPTSYIGFQVNSDGELLSIMAAERTPFSGDNALTHNILTGVSSDVQPTRRNITGKMSDEKPDIGFYLTPKGMEVHEKQKEDSAFDWFTGKLQRKNKKPRSRDMVGENPKLPNIIDRWFSAEGRQWMRETRAAKRLEKGRAPRATDTLRERLSRRLARLSYDFSDRPLPEELLHPYATDISMLPIISQLADDVVEPHDLWSATSAPNVLSDLKAIPAPDGIHPSRWRNDDEVTQPLLDLNNDLMRMGGFSPRPTEFDAEHQDDLFRMYEEAVKRFNDPNYPDAGVPSNMGLAEVKEDGTRVLVYDTTKPHKPLAMILDNKSGTTHIIGEDGKHLLSVVERKDMNDKPIMVIIAGRGARERIDNNDVPAGPNFVQRAIGKFKKRGLQPASRTARTQRAAQRTVTRSSTRTALTYPKTTSGDMLTSGIDYGAAHIDLLQKEMGKHLASLRADWQKHLNIGPNDPIDEDAALDYLDNLKKTNPRLAGIRSSTLHDLMVLSEWEDNQDHMMVNNLKPGRRNAIIDAAGITTGVDRSKKKAFARHTPSSQPGTSPTVKPRIFRRQTQRTPGWVNPLETTVKTPRPRNVTGPQLTPGVGNPALNITHNATGYFDNTTGLYIEDLSGLPDSNMDVFTPVSLKPDDYPNLVTLPLDQNPAIRPRRNVVVSAGMDIPADDKRVQLTTNPREAIQTTDVVPTFSEAIDSLKDAGLVGDGPNQTKPESIPRPVKIEFGNMVTPDDLDSNDLVVNAQANRDANGFFRPWPIHDATNKPRHPTANTYLPSSGTLRGIDLDNLGIDSNLPFRRFYSPSETAGTPQSYRTQAMYRGINAALQLEDCARMAEEAAKTQDINLLNETARLFNRPITQQFADELRVRADKQWKDTYGHLLVEHGLNSQDMAHAARAYSISAANGIGNPGAAQDFVRLGNYNEQLEYFMREHITSDPEVNRILSQTGRSAQEETARRANRQILNRRARAAAAPSGQTTTSTAQNFGFFDDVPEVLDVHAGQTAAISNQPARLPAELDDLKQQHKATGVSDGPEIDVSTGAIIPGELSDDAIEALAQMDDAHKEYPNNPAVSAHPDLTARQTTFPNIAHMLMGSFWEWSGFNSKPILVSDEELESLATEVDGDGNPTHLIISRGLTDYRHRNRQVTAEQLTNDIIRGDRWVPDGGQRSFGAGEYWSLLPNSWHLHHGQKGTTLGVITRDDIISSNLVDTMLNANSNSPVYEALWAIANAVGAPGFGNGVNTSHGRHFGLDPNSLLPDPITGLVDTATLSQVIDDWTHHDPLAPNGGSFGPLTIEGMHKSGLYSSLTKSLMPVPGMTPEEEAAQAEYRQKMNAWLYQFASNALQLLEKRQDESQPGQAGTDAKAFNERLNKALHSLVFMDGQNRAAMMGATAVVTSTHLHTHNTPYSVVPELMWKEMTGAPQQYSHGNGKGSGNVIRVLNRSGVIMSNHPWNLRDAYTTASQYKLPNGRQIPHIEGGVNWDN